MPFVSEAQRRLMYAAAKGGVDGVSQAVAKKFIADSKGKMKKKRAKKVAGSIKD